MKKAKANISVFYIFLIAFTAIAIFLVFKNHNIDSSAMLNKSPGTTSAGTDFMHTLSHNMKHGLSVLILQIIVIVIFARIFGTLFQKIKQPAVIGEIAAGLLLGPSFVGYFFPEFSAFIFPPDSLANLGLLSQVGLILFMFIIGMELDLHIIKKEMSAAVLISHASIVIPYILGMCLASFIYDAYAPKGISFISFALFMGIAMSITAFPVLARIIQERKMSETGIGMLTITCAASDDVTAWCILAVVLALVKAGTVYSALYTILLSFGYVLLMLYMVKPLLAKLDENYFSKKNPNQSVIALMLLLLLFSAYLTEIIGIHAIFGAFLAGIVMPQNKQFRKHVAGKIETVSVVLLIPIFFVITGLKTELGSLNKPELWLACGAIILIAILGKLGGSAIAARLVGLSWKHSLVIGILMNTRGLMELIVLNLGYEEGILSKEIFSMMVLMALFTTLMTGPLLSLTEKMKEGTDEVG